ncbi:MAG TPA: hypothetical protein VJT73_17300 [Polyangiaceae bacterium]|nr:hypothetical protein [Polyangiaceae bacterium]
MRSITWALVVVCVLSLCGLGLVIKMRGDTPSPIAAAGSASAINGEASVAERARTMQTVPRLVTAASTDPDKPADTAEAPQPHDKMTAAEERDQKIAWLKTTGPDRDNLIAQAENIARAWNKLAEKLLAGAAFGRMECYRRGCYGTAIHGSAGTIDDLTREISQSTEFRDWNGPKMRTGPVIRKDGNVEVTWVLFTQPAELDTHAANTPE